MEKCSSQALKIDCKIMRLKPTTLIHAGQYDSQENEIPNLTFKLSSRNKLAFETS